MFQEIKFYIEDNKIAEQLKECQIPVFCGSAEAGDNVLVFTDSEDTAFLAKEQGACVVAVLTEGNKACFFDGIRYAVEGVLGIDDAYIQKVYQRYRNLPWTIFATKRCVVREVTVEDVDRLYEIYKDPAVAGTIEPLFAGREQEVEYIKKYIENIYGFYGYGIWVVEEKETGKVIGRAGIEHKSEEEGAELGYVIAGEYQRQGYAYEVCRGIIEYAENQLEITRIYSYVEPGNVPSEQLCRKLGMEEIGIREVKNIKYGFFERK